MSRLSGFVCQPPMIIMGCLKLLKLISKSNIVERPSVIIDHHALLADHVCAIDRVCFEVKRIGAVRETSQLPSNSARLPTLLNTTT